MYAVMVNGFKSREQVEQWLMNCAELHDAIAENAEDEYSYSGLIDITIDSPESKWNDKVLICEVINA